MKIHFIGPIGRTKKQKNVAIPWHTCTYQKVQAIAEKPKKNPKSLQKTNLETLEESLKEKNFKKKRKSLKKTTKKDYTLQQKR